MRASNLTLISISVALLAAARAEAVCTPSATKICIGEQGFGLTVQTGSGAAVRRGALTLYTGATYTLEMGTTLTSTPHNFLLTTHAVGGGAATVPYSTNVTGTQPMDTEGQSITFAPAEAQIGTTLYYQCGVHGNMGAQVNIVAGPPPVVDAGIQPADAGTGDGGGGSDGGSNDGGGGGGSGGPPSGGGLFGCSAATGMSLAAFLLGTAWLLRRGRR